MNAVSQTTAKILVQVAVPTNGFIQITRMWIENADVEASQQTQGEVVRLSAAATVTSFTPLKKGSPGQGASGCVGGTSLTGVNASTAGTVTDTFMPRGFNVLQGWEWIAANEMDRIAVPGGGFIGLRLAATVAATVISAGIDYFEWN
jgi:hypothetical protein